MKVYSETKSSTDGHLFNIRYLLDKKELLGLQKAGLVGEVNEVIGMQEAAKSIVASYEAQQHFAEGGALQ